MSKKIPATIVTGFLGAGKTTMIQHMLANADDQRLALIINEFGDIGIDGDVLKGCGIENCAEDDILELSNGCICCTVAEDFIPTMEKLLERDEKPDHIVIETSGLALPQPLVQAFNWPDIKTHVTVDGVITLVDGAALNDGTFAHDEAALKAQRESDEMLDHETPLAELFEDQLACADMIVLNKADLLASQELDRVEDELKSEIREGVTIIRAIKGEVDPKMLLGLNISAEDDLEARRAPHHDAHHHHEDKHDDHDHEDHHHHHDHDEFMSFSVDLGEVADMKAFKQKLQQTIRQFGIIRLKGFASLTDKPMRLVIQAVGPRLDTYFDRPLTQLEKGKTSLVVIGMADMDEASIREALTS